tara:strand:+ start:246 stop:1370 length:1125 start_codon:yes stop_codon:yes gene_type:complete
MQSKEQIYFDVAATTPVDEEVINLINKINLNYFGNPSSIHRHGQKSHNLIEKSRISIANSINCNPSEIIFTSGGSESNNLVLKGVLNAGDHLITSSYEHPSILSLAKSIEKKGIEVTYIQPEKTGLINIESIEKNIKSNTKLISIMYVNNEIGTINPINEISQIAQDHNIFFHTDAVQIIGKKIVSVKNIDFMSVGAHKFYGPKGIGFLYAKKGAIINPIIEGGGQENGFRAGTENLSFIAGMDLALKKSIQNISKNQHKIVELENLFLKKLDQEKINYRINGKNRLPGFLNITFYGIDGNNLLINLDMKNISISYGSACSSGTSKPPIALLEIGMPKNEAKSSVRISIGKFINETQITELIIALKNIIERINI